MFALQTQKCGRRREPASRALRGAGRIMGWAAHVVATLTLLTFVMDGPSQACPGRNKPTPNPTPLVTQSAAQVIAKQSAVAPPVVKIAFKISACCGDGSGHRHGLAGAGACCPACSAGVIGAGWNVAQGLILHFDLSAPQMRLSSIERDTQFRPPRVIL